MNERVRNRLLVALGCAVLAWWAWTGQRRAAAERDAVQEARVQAAHRADADQREGERRELLGRVTERLARRAAPPADAAALREAFHVAAAEEGVELSSARLQPVVRPPAGTGGTEARISLLGDPGALSRFLSTIGNRGWPIRMDRAALAVRGGLGTLTATVVVLWPDPESSFDEGDVARLSGDDRLDDLLAWLDAPSLAAAAPAAGPAPPLAPEPDTIGRERIAGGPADATDTPSAATTLAGPETPELRGFVDLGPETPVRAAIQYRGETTLVAVGDALGAFTVLRIEPETAVVLERPGGPPLRLILR